MDADARESKVVNNAPPFHFGPSEVDEQGEVKPGGFQVVDAFGKVVGGELVNTFDFHEQAIFHDQVRHIRTDVLALVSDGERRLGLHAETTTSEFFDQRPFVDLFQESRPRMLLTS